MTTTVVSPARSRGLLTKVPAVTALFWVVKVLTTGMGESASDYLAQRSLWLSAAVGIAGLAFTLTRQLRSTGYRAITYWSNVAMIAVFGTVAADVFRVGLGVPLVYTTAGYAGGLAVVLGLWWRSQRTLSIHSINTPARERFYWATVLLTFALGTAAGDLTAFVVNLGFANSAALFAAAILVPWGLFQARILGAVPAFWTAYVLTRPLGASVADWLGKDKPLGLGWGDGTVTAASLVIIGTLVGYLALSRPDVQGDSKIS